MYLVPSQEVYLPAISFCYVEIISKTKLTENIMVMFPIFVYFIIIALFVYHLKLNWYYLKSEKNESNRRRQRYSVFIASDVLSITSKK